MENTVVSSMEKKFFPNACHVCRAYGKDIKLKRCTGCRMIAYCGRAHQIEHWPKHKNFCKKLSKLITVAEIFFKINPISKDPAISWTESRDILINYIEATLGRRVSNIELEMMSYRRSCEICHEMDPQKLQDCTECPGASFCIEHPKDSKHSAKCKMLKFSMEYNDIIVGYNISLPSTLFYYGTSVPINIDQVIEPYLLYFPMDKNFTSQKMWATFLSEELTRPFTFYHAMGILSRPKLHEMTIHVIGSNFKETTNVHLWQYLLTQDKTLKKLKIVFIGPELGSSYTEFTLRDECKRNNRKTKMYTVSGLYAEFAAGPTFTKPDYVIGFNLGFCAFPIKQDTWAPTIHVLAKLGCPFFITAFASYEPKTDEKRINLVLGKEIEPFWTGKNPFSCLKPLREYNDEFSYTNQYLTIYEKLS